MVNQHTISVLRLSDELRATYHRILNFFIHKIPMVEETDSTYLMLEILNNFPPQTIKHAWMRKWHTHTHTHTHTHIHTMDVKKEQHIITYHDSVLSYHTKISIQSFSK